MPIIKSHLLDLLGHIQGVASASVNMAFGQKTLDGRQSWGVAPRLPVCRQAGGDRRHFLPCWVSTGESTIRKPNILSILVNDLGWADVPWYGSDYKLPHLDRLAAEGVRLESHYVHPMCSPTRAALMTGRYASRFGVTAAQNNRALPFDTATLAGVLQSVGYRTAITGKWPLGSKPEWGPQRFGFDHGYGSLAGGCGPYDHRYKTGGFTHTRHRNGRLIEEEGHITGLIAREAVEWLKQRSEKPFFLYLPPKSPPATGTRPGRGRDRLTGSAFAPFPMLSQPPLALPVPLCL